MISKEIEWELDNSTTERLEELLECNMHNQFVVDAISEELQFRNFN